MSYDVNFIWIQAERLQDTEAQDTLANPIPERLMENVAAFARDYPDVDVSVWVDLYGKGQHSSELTENLGSQVDLPNVRFRALDEIEKYKDSTVFDEAFDDWQGVIWDKVDYARLVLMEHLVHTNAPDHASIYSDMDVDFSKNFELFVATLEHEGAAIGLQFQHGDYGLENQIFGFSPKHKGFVSDVLACPADERELQGLEPYYNRFVFAFDPDQAAPYGLRREDIAVVMDELPHANDIKYSYQERSPYAPEVYKTLIIDL